MATQKLLIIGTAFMAGALLALGPRPWSGARAQVQSAGAMATQTTASYRVELDIQPAMMMLMPDQMGGMGMGMSGTDSSVTGMMMTDGGQQANHFFEVRVTTTAAGAPGADTGLSIAIANDMTGEVRSLSGMMPMTAMMNAVQMGMGDLQFANNVYLPDGSYAITVMVGSETAQFSHVMIADAMGMH